MRQEEGRLQVPKVPLVADRVEDTILGVDANKKGTEYRDRFILRKVF